MRARKSAPLLALACISGLLGGCSLFAGEPQLETLSGQLTSETTTSLPADATIEVRLIEHGGDDTTLATTELHHPGPFPIDYQLRYDAAALRTDHRYTLDATIRVNTRVRYLNGDTVPLSTEHDPGQPLDIPMVPVNRPDA
ncbi:type III secretion system (T3SS) chaperone YscW [Kushneria sinocarnis]|uniref:Type III secretion system (T3SS) chaperone YscW n=1 Tax=Kushneria sinocarnis TaxID=595502 RepID=A0A420WW59_9GAMM|nr:YbaY family lipoprotein [Kushneria sinocarnis]RKR03320.1 type III secretion system (T3SS) chaperone YscW [Kushneria sinocarnis]